MIGSPSSVKVFRPIPTGDLKELQIICIPYSGAHTTSSSGISATLIDLDNDKDLDLLVASPWNVLTCQYTKGLFVERSFFEDHHQ